MPGNSQPRDANRHPRACQGRRAARRRDSDAGADRRRPQPGYSTLARGVEIHLAPPRVREMGANPLTTWDESSSQVMRKPTYARPQAREGREAMTTKLTIDAPFWRIFDRPRAPGLELLRVADRRGSVGVQVVGPTFRPALALIYVGATIARLRQSSSTRVSESCHDGRGGAGVLRGHRFPQDAG